MKLIKYQVTNFRSVDESGWIDAEEVTALIGVNESGKTNLLLPLWKFNPARDGELQPTSDYPKRMFGEIRANPGQYCFITADFDTEGLRPKFAAATNVSDEQLGVVRVSKYYDGEYQIEFPNYAAKTAISAADVKVTLQRLLSELDGAEALKQEESLKTALREEVRLVAESIVQDWVAKDVESFGQALKKHLPDQPAKTSTLVPRLSQILEVMDDWLRQLQVTAPGEVDGVKQLVLNELPKFVYYSNYGNLDSEIYLP